MWEMLVRGVDLDPALKAGMDVRAQSIPSRV